MRRYRTDSLSRYAAPFQCRTSNNFRPPFAVAPLSNLDGSLLIIPSPCASTDARLPGGAIIAVQTFGDFLGFNPHCHILETDGCFYGNKGMFRIAPSFELKKLEAIFRHRVFRMLLSKGKITEEMIRMLST